MKDRNDTVKVTQLAIGNVSISPSIRRKLWHTFTASDEMVTSADNPFDKKYNWTHYES